MKKNNIEFLHISNDEKFIDTVIVQFESVAKGKSIYLINGESKNKLKFVKSQHPSIIVLPYFCNEFWDVFEQLKPKFVFIHGLSIKHKIVLSRIKNKYKIFLSSWGRDIFSSKKLNHLMYKKDTKKLKTNLYWKHYGFKHWIGINIKKIFYSNYRVKDLRYYLKYINFMSTVVKEDYDLLRSAYPKETEHIKFIPFNYGGIIPKKTNNNLFLNGENILIGNSANYENNHIEIFNLLKNTYIGKRKIIVPLSYGGDEYYKKYLLYEGKKNFGNSFVPLLDFIPSSDYNKILDSIGIAFMNHLHQHAMGNIFRLIYNGAKVYMEPRNTAYQHLKNLNVKIFNINEIDDFLEPLPINIKEKNRRIIIKYYSDEAILLKTKNLINELFKYIDK